MKIGSQSALQDQMMLGFAATRVWMVFLEHPPPPTPVFSYCVVNPEGSLCLIFLTQNAISWARRLLN